ncbi:MAG: histidine phosphatase family protein [Desulfovibrio sp.]|jgi:probable phosphoglycerate mutase|nr:histidine phosphatase family protein [Desulfovibrio sp.]
MKEICLVRHGALPPNPQRRFIGASDIPLSETGREQISALAVDLNDALRGGALAAIYCSDLSRGRESAAILSASAPGVPLLHEPELREICLGQWEGRTPAEVERCFPGQYAERGRNIASFRPPDGESFAMLRQRALAAHARMRARFPDGLLLVVGHAGLNRVLLAEYLALPLPDALRIPQPYACLSFLARW